MYQKQKVLGNVDCVEVTHVGGFCYYTTSKNALIYFMDASQGSLHGNQLLLVSLAEFSYVPRLPILIVGERIWYLRSGQVARRRWCLSKIEAFVCARGRSSVRGGVSVRGRTEDRTLLVQFLGNPCEARCRVMHGDARIVLFLMGCNIRHEF